MPVLVLNLDLTVEFSANRRKGVKCSTIEMK